MQAHPFQVLRVLLEELSRARTAWRARGAHDAIKPHDFSGLTRLVSRFIQRRPRRLVGLLVAMTVADQQGRCAFFRSASSQTW